jgi:hypothetical protein
MVNGPFRYAISDVWIAVKAQALGSRHYQYSGKTLGALLTNFIHDMPNSFSQAKALLSFGCIGDRGLSVFG